MQRAKGHAVSFTVATLRRHRRSFTSSCGHAPWISGHIATANAAILGDASHRWHSNKSPGIVRSTDSWDKLPPAQQQAWVVLGWTAQSWDGHKHPPVSKLKSWDELDSREQGAAMYGLGYTQDSWNLELHGDLIEQQDTSASAETHSTSAKGGEGSSKTFQTVLSVFRKVLPVAKYIVKSSPRLRRGILGSVLDTVSHIDDAMVQSAHGGAIEVVDTEDVVYLDDSASMAWVDKLPRAQSLWSEMANRLQATPTRIIKFGSDKHVITPRVETFSSTAVALNWDGSSGGTYMWEMILDDICSNYSPGKGRLRVFVITDGVDVDSNPPYRGMQGMDPMMRDLRQAGFNIEFHIVFVSESSFFQIEGITNDGLARYKDLALATGGGFLHLDGSESDEDRCKFLAHVENVTPEAGNQLHIAAKREYEQRLQIGEGTRFEWYNK